LKGYEDGHLSELFRRCADRDRQHSQQRDRGEPRRSRQYLHQRRGRAHPGRTPTVANTSLIKVSGSGGADIISLVESNGALPAARAHDPAWITDFNSSLPPDHRI
jgi:hypothetical protein